MYLEAPEAHGAVLRANGKEQLLGVKVDASDRRVCGDNEMRNGASEEGRDRVLQCSSVSIVCAASAQIFVLPSSAPVTSH